MLLPPSVMVPKQLLLEILFATMEFRSVTLPLVAWMAPPATSPGRAGGGALLALLATKVAKSTNEVPPPEENPPPLAAPELGVAEPPIATFPETVQFKKVRSPPL